MSEKRYLDLDGLKTVVDNSKTLFPIKEEVAFINIEENEDVQETAENVLPTVSNADNGKVLKVVNGVWTAVSNIYSEEVAY